MRVAAVSAAAVALVMAASAWGGPEGKPSLVLLNVRPLTLQGSNFDSRERVNVQASANAHGSRRVVATRSGSFVVRFDSLATSRCELLRAVAVGGSGSRATLKYLPAPVCRADLRPGGSRPGGPAG